jgi:protein-S-isoprenylcysteine O-methyltransferase Ste14
MNVRDEVLFRVIFAVLWMLYFAVRLYFQGRVRRQRLEYETFNVREEKRYFSLFALAYLLLTLYFLTPWIDFAHLSLPLWLRVAGGIITLVGILLFGLAHQALGKNWTAVLALAREHEMVECGPYRRIRHPMYSAFFAIGIGFALLSANWLAALVYLIPLTMMYLARVGREEEIMTERFGDRYRLYMQRTHRLWPRLTSRS